DKDGYIAGEDCDDSNPTISPGAEEVWYDGIDSDCLQDDDYDSDSDGYVTDEHAGLATEGVATSGELPGGDCDDKDDIISPEAADAWYDGVDSDCGGEDDYDADADGYIDEDFGGLVTTYAAGSGSLPVGDCDDTNDNISPAAADTWYDGIDNDCGGEDDYDADDDGHVEDDFQGLTTEYVSGSGGLPGGDCDDTNPFAYTGAPETDYDGLDWDCAGDDDYDGDGDGYVPDTYLGQETIGVSGSGELPGGDCDDTDAEINPGQIEVLSDSRDLDCDQDGAVTGGTSFTAASIENFSNWTDPFSPSFDENIQGVFLSLAAYQLKEGTTNYYDSALAVSFDPLTPLSGATGTYVWLKHVVNPSSYDLTGGHDFVLTNEYLFGVTGLLFDTQRSIRLGGFDLLYGINGLSGQVFSTSLTTSPFVDMSITIDGDGTLYAAGCDDDDGIVQYMRASLASAADSDVDAEAVITGVTAEACEIAIGDDADTGLLYSTQSLGFATDSFALSSDNPTLSRESLDTNRSPQTISSTDRDGDWLVIADPGALYIIDGDGTSYIEAVGEGPTDAEASIAPDGSLVIAYVDGDGDAHVLYGDPAAGMSRFDVQADFAVTEAAAWAEGTGTYLMVALIGTNDVAYGAAEL
ncbi:MAG: hypothetical protein ACI8S6_005174, partial [Myxococcota bacterium]